MASLLADVIDRGQGLAGLVVSYVPERIGGSDGEQWRLPLASWGIGPFADPTKLEAYADVHRVLSRELPQHPAVRLVLECLRQAYTSVQAFEAALSPDAVLRRIVTQGTCRACGP